MRFWNSPHAQFGGFKLVPYATVSSIVNNLDDQQFNSLPKQPDPKPSKKKPSPKAFPKSSDPSASSSKTSGPGQATPKTILTDAPPPDNPLEEPNIWCEILKLEGRQHENRVAEGFQTWLKKSLDCSLFEVQNTSNFIKFLLHF